MAAQTDIYDNVEHGYAVSEGGVKIHHASLGPPGGPRNEAAAGSYRKRGGCPPGAAASPAAPPHAALTSIAKHETTEMKRLAGIPRPDVIRCLWPEAYAEDGAPRAR